MTHILDTSSATWVLATKTKGLRAKAIAEVFPDPVVRAALLLHTLEGDQPLNDQNILCRGVGDEFWQQTRAAIDKKYFLHDIDTDGWATYLPKPENSVECFEITDWPHGGIMQGLWGETTFDGLQNMQWFANGDFVCRQPHDHSDQWIVNRTLFKRTYEVISA